MSKQLARTVISSFNMQAALLAPTYADVLVDSFRMLSSANAGEEDRERKESQVELLSSYGYSAGQEDKTFAYADGVAFIPITGLLINRFSRAWGWVTGYNAIRQQMNAALEDDDVKAIVFDVNSGGGQVVGCFELAADIHAARGKKPTMAVIDAYCFSAAYALACAADRVVITPSGQAGSIGALAMHFDQSKMLEDWGIKVSMIYSGEHKTDGNSFEALPDKVRANIQKDVDAARNEFVDLVARNRGLERQAVFNTEAQVYSATEAISAGLVDAVTPPIEAVWDFINGLSGLELSKENSMSTQDTSPGAEQPATPAAASKAAAATDTTATAAGTADTRTSERQRIKEITTCAEATGKSKLANHLALETEMTVDAARGILAASAEEKTASATSPLEAAMAGTSNPEVGADVAGAETGGELSASQRILKAQELATGAKLH